MIIGIDVDGTLTDIAGFMIEKGGEFFQRPAVDPKAFDIEQMFGCSHKERNLFWRKHLPGYCRKMPIVDGAAETIRKLRDDGHKICIVTSRVYATRKDPVGYLFRSMLRGWLRRNGVVYDEIVFCEDSGESKLENCQKLGVDVMIDDKPENLLALSGKHSVIACPMPWNEDIEEKGITRSRDWNEIYDCIKDMKN